jgi:hypothetical protein
MYMDHAVVGCLYVLHPEENPIEQRSTINKKADRTQQSILLTDLAVIPAAHLC